jgi:TolB-like protein
MRDLKDLIHEIHRRSLWQVLGIYLVASWGVLEAVDGIAANAGLPDWLPVVALILLLVGLPVVMATAFIQEGTAGRPGEVFERSAPPADGGERDAQHVLTWRNALAGGIGAFALWGVIAGIWILRGGAPAGAVAASADELALRSQADLPTVAVLPFTNMSQGDDFTWFADGVHEDILTGLSKLSGLRVISRTSVMQYRDPTQSMKEIGEALGATAIIEGSVSRFRDQVRITAQLIDATSDAHLWADNFDRNVDDFFAVRSEIALEVADALQATLTPDELRRVSAEPTEEMSTYDLYLEGRQVYTLYQPDANERAIQLFKQAIAADAGFALPWAGLADAYSQNVVRWGLNIEWAPDSAMHAAETAVSLDPESPEAHKALGLVRSMWRDNDGAIDSYRRALELNPNYQGAANNLGVTYSQMGNRAEAAIWYATALRLNPNGPFARINLSSVLANLGFFEEAMRIAREDVRLNGETSQNLLALVIPPYGQGLERDSVLAWAERRAELDAMVASTRNWSAWVILWGGDLESAGSHARAALRLSPEGVYGDAKGPRTVLAQIALLRGDAATADELLDEGQAVHEAHLGLVRDPWTFFHLGVIHALRGEAAEAVSRLETAFELEINYPWIYEQEAAFDSIRDDPAFHALMDRVRTEWADMRARVPPELIDGR